MGWGSGRDAASGGGAGARLSGGSGQANRQSVVTADKLTRLDRETTLRRGDFRIVSYEGGVTYAGMLLASEAQLVAARGEEAPVVRDARKRLVALYERWGKADEARAWQAKVADRP